MWGQLGDYFGTIQAGTTFRSFLAANSAQKYFLTALILSFCDIHDKSALVNILRQNMTIYLHGKWIDRKYIKRTWGNVESESLSISSFYPFLFIFSFSLHFLTAKLAGLNNLCGPVSALETFCLQSWNKFLEKKGLRSFLFTKGVHLPQVSATRHILENYLFAKNELIVDHNDCLAQRTKRRHICENVERTHSF